MSESEAVNWVIIDLVLHYQFPEPCSVLHPSWTEIDLNVPKNVRKLRFSFQCPSNMHRLRDQLRFLQSCLILKRDFQHICSFFGNFLIVTAKTSS